MYLIFFFFIRMAVSLPYGARCIDLLYEQIARNTEFGIVGFAGDSHVTRVAGRCIKIFQEPQSKGRKSFRYTNAIYAKGGLNCEGWFNMFYSSLLDSQTNVVIMLIGGNDLDTQGTNHVDVLNRQIKLFNQITAIPMIVYLCELPARFSVRTPGLTVDQYKSERKKLVSKQIDIFKNRLIQLPSQFFNIDNFQKQKNERRQCDEYVHLKDDFYEYLATAIVQHITVDFTNRKSPPLQEKISIV